MGQALELEAHCFIVREGKELLVICFAEVPGHAYHIQTIISFLTRKISILTLLTAWGLFSQT